MTGEEWDAHWHRIRNDWLAEGAQPLEASVRADADMAEQFGPPPEESP